MESKNKNFCKQFFMELLHVKEFTAFLSLIFGFGLTVASFIVDPTGIVDDSVLWILGQCFLYAGSIYGISTHYASKQQELEDEIHRKLNNKN